MQTALHWSRIRRKEKYGRGANTEGRFDRPEMRRMREGIHLHPRRRKPHKSAAQIRNRGAPRERGLPLRQHIAHSRVHKIKPAERPITAFFHRSISLYLLRLFVLTYFFDRFRFNLTYALAGYAEFFSNLFERPHNAIFQPETEF